MALARPRPGLVARIAREVVWQVGLLPEAERATLLGLAERLIESVRWEGLGGQTLSDSVRVSIATQAALLALGFGGLPWPGLRTVLVYPDDFYGAPHPEGLRLSAGESWDSSIVLSWRGAELGGLHPRYPNLVAHEFAHALDRHDDAAGGFRRFADDGERTRFRARLDDLRDAHCVLEARRRPNQLGAYALTDLHEFFAEASASFVQTPLELLGAHPEAYALMRDFYLQDPAARDGEALRGRPDPPQEEARQFDEAQLHRELRQVEEALRRHPEAVPAMVGGARILQRLERAPEALELYRRALAASPGDADLLHETARALADADRHLDAIELFDAALRLVPSWALALKDRGTAWVALGDWERAERDFAAALGLDPELDVAWYGRAQMHVARADVAEALRCVDRALALLPGDPDYEELRAQILESLGGPGGGAPAAPR